MANEDMARKRTAAQRIKTMTEELNQPDWKELLDIRTTLLIEYGVEVKKALDYLRSIHPKYKDKEGLGTSWKD